uniref:homeobox-leucine zipper protein ATHB-7-like n=1 Tax=Erigeron canadensis TaxID=72917 RepID=UPI001CB92A29|nr:homeobox-leucine zipper protein ATHB-7-like [Erigeron canadensis]
MSGEGRKKKNKNEGRSRFSDEQIQFLEYMFETQSRPELRMKQQLANQIGLQPRQVAIWFQNRRARSKSRQTKQEYDNLKHTYETLASKSESLKEENQDLLTQLHMLRDLAKTQEGGITNKSCNDECGNITLSQAENSLANYRHEISLPFYAGTSYVGEDDRILENEEHMGSFGSERPSWWQF